MGEIAHKKCAKCRIVFEYGRDMDNCWCTSMPVKEIIVGLDCMCKQCFELQIHEQKEAKSR